MNSRFKHYLFFFVLFSLFSCEKENVEELATLSTENLSFKKTGESRTIVVTTNSKNWSFTIPQEASWIRLDRSSGSRGTTAITVMAEKNTTTIERRAILQFKTDGGINKELHINQSGNSFPSYNISQKNADDLGMRSTAMELASKMKFGWNAGNTLEAMGGETAWGNPMITSELIKTVKENGFNAIRLPCAWYQYADKSTAKISDAWLNRIKDVIKMCVDNDVYVILNIHWDGGWLENNVTAEKRDENNERQKAFWEQIATHLRDFDEHLLFAGTNEPNVDNQIQMDVLDTYHQTFVDAVRSTGGKNSYRVLVIQGPSTDIDKTNKLMSKWPTDPEPDKLMAEVHFYTPWNFCGLSQDESWGKQFYYWGKNNHSLTDVSRNPTWGEEATVDELFDLMKKKFIDNNIPVIIGEFNALRRLNLTGDALALHIKSRNYYLNYVTKKCIDNKFIPFYWDTGVYENGSGIFDRRTYEITDKGALEALTYVD